MHQIIQKTRDELLGEISGGTSGRKEIKLPMLVEVYDSNCGDRYGSHTILVSSLSWDRERGKAVCLGDYYDDGTWVGKADPFDVEDLETDELGAIAEVLKAALRKGS